MTDLVYRLRKRAEIRRQIPTRRSVQEGKPDRLADLLDEAADELVRRGYHAHDGVKCPRCEGVAVSTHTHHFANCPCGFVWADGGCEYLRWGGEGELVTVECPAQ